MAGDWDIPQKLKILSKNSSFARDIPQKTQFQALANYENCSFARDI